MKLAGVTRGMLRQVGYDVRRFRPLVSDPFFAQQYLLRGRPCRVVLDLGSYQGDAAASYARQFPQADIYAFEPFPPMYHLLSERFAGEPRIHPVNAAVSSQTGTAVFHVNGLAATNSLLQRPAAGPKYFPPEGATRETISVSTITLDEFCEQNKIAEPDILKMDIQGNELEALRGAEKILRKGTIAAIFTEVMFVPHYEGGVLFNELCSHLSGHGYTLYNIYDLHWASVGQLRFADALFISAELRNSIVDRQPSEQ